MKEIMEVEGQKVVRMQRHKERGIDLTFNKEKKTILVSGWYNCFCKIWGEEISLKEILDLFGMRMCEMEIKEIS